MTSKRNINKDKWYWENEKQYILEQWNKVKWEKTLDEFANDMAEKNIKDELDKEKNSEKESHKKRKTKIYELNKFINLFLGIPIMLILWILFIWVIILGIACLINPENKSILHDIHENIHETFEGWNMFFYFLFLFIFIFYIQEITDSIDGERLWNYLEYIRHKICIVLTYIIAICFYLLLLIWLITLLINYTIVTLLSIIIILLVILILKKK